MQLATIDDNTRDGRLLVVSRGSGSMVPPSRALTP